MLNNVYCSHKNLQLIERLISYGFNSTEFRNNAILRVFFKYTNKELEKELQCTEFCLNVIVFPLESIHFLSCYVPTLIIYNDACLIKCNIMSIKVNSNSPDLIANIIYEWASTVLQDFEECGNPVFKRIRSEEVSCRMISFKDEIDLVKIL